MNQIKYPIKIAVSGQLGSGKSVVCKMLAKRLGIKYYSTGNILREIAVQRGVSVLELNLEAEENRKFDDTIDNFSRKLNHQNESFIIDSRIAWNFIDKAIRVFLKVDSEEAARRVMKDGGRRSERYSTLKEALESIRFREESEKKRYFKLYQVNFYDFKNYHLVVDTTQRSPEETVVRILENIPRFQSGEQNHLVLD